MCLDVVTKRYLIPQEEEFTAWKKFETDGIILKSPFRDFSNVVGKWLHAKGFVDHHGLFRTGFYCYKYKTSQLGYQHSSWVSRPCIPVRVRGLVTEGRLWDDDIVIVRELFIPVNWKELALHVRPKPDRQPVCTLKVDDIINSWKNVLPTIAQDAEDEDLVAVG